MMHTNVVRQGGWIRAFGAMVPMNSMNDVMVASIVTLSVIVLGAYFLGMVLAPRAFLNWFFD
jgi:hypothetical protein